MQVSFPGTPGACRNLAARSITGKTLPRRLITPRIHSGVLGTRVTVSYSMISFTLRRLIAYSTPPIMNVRYCWTFCSASWLFSCCLICMGALLEPGKVVFQCGTVNLLRRNRRNWLLERLVLRRRPAGSGYDSFSGHTEERHELLQGFGLRGQLFGGAGEFFRR